MTHMLEDGTGSGKLAKVDANNRLLTRTVTRDASSEASVTDGKSYNINTGTITLTSDNESSVIYLKNNETIDSIVISAFIYIVGASTGGTGDSFARVVRNPTSGTTVTNANDAAIAGVNRNFGANRALAADLYKGAEGETLTGGVDFIQSILGTGSYRYFIAAGDVVLPPGASVGVLFTPANSNTNQDLQVAISAHLETL